MVFPARQLARAGRRASAPSESSRFRIVRIASAGAAAARHQVRMVRYDITAGKSKLEKIAILWSRSGSCSRSAGAPEKRI